MTFEPKDKLHRHNARQPKKLRKHEVRKRWGDLQQQDALHERELLLFNTRELGRRPNYYQPWVHPEPDGA